MSEQGITTVITSIIRIVDLSYSDWVDCGFVVFVTEISWSIMWGALVFMWCAFVVMWGSFFMWCTFMWGVIMWCAFVFMWGFCHYVMCFCRYVGCFCIYVKIYAKLSRINAKLSRNNAKLFVYIHAKWGGFSYIRSIFRKKNHDMLNLYVRFQK